MIEPGGNVRVRMIDGVSYGGVVVMMDELELVIQCTHDYVNPLDIDGVEEQIHAVLDQLSWRQMMVMAVDSGHAPRSISGSPTSVWTGTPNHTLTSTERTWRNGPHQDD